MVRSGTYYELGQVSRLNACGYCAEGQRAQEIVYVHAYHPIVGRYPLHTLYAYAERSQPHTHRRNDVLTPPARRCHGVLRKSAANTPGIIEHAHVLQHPCP